MEGYEERYRLTGLAVLAVAAVVLLIAAGLILWHFEVIFVVIAVVLLLLIAQGAGVIDMARRTVAFRANHKGITLGAVPDKLTVRRGSPLFIPWDDIKSIIFYPAYPQMHGRYALVQCIGIQRREDAPPLRWGNEQAPGCPVPGVPTWATRRIVGWRLDRGQLAAVIEAAAPGTPIINTNTDPNPSADPGKDGSNEDTSAA